MQEPKTIYCPECCRKVFQYDGKSKINPQGKCRKCNRLIVYDIATDTVSVKKIPERTQGSGMRFY